MRFSRDDELGLVGNAEARRLDHRKIIRPIAECK